MSASVTKKTIFSSRITRYPFLILGNTAVGGFRHGIALQLTAVSTPAHFRAARRRKRRLAALGALRGLINF
jgi:hypothetical protein